MLDMNRVEELASDGVLQESLLSPDVALQAYPAVYIGSAEADRFQGGQAVEAAAEATSGLARVYGGKSEFLGVGELSDDGWLAPRRVFQMAEIAL